MAPFWRFPHFLFGEALWISWASPLLRFSLWRSLEKFGETPLSYYDNEKMDSREELPVEFGHFTKQSRSNKGM